MIRIDEIYNNTFLPLMQYNQCAHFFDPFGTTAFENLCQVPYIENADTNFLFWDQEPLHPEIHHKTFDQFVDVFKPKRTILVTSEYNSDSLKYICNKYKFESAYYFFHGWAALDWYRGYNRSFLHQPTQIEHTFMCLNNIVGGKREHRLKLFSELDNRRLLKNNLVSFPEVCPFEQKTVSTLLRDLGLPEPKTTLPLALDDFANYANNSHQINLWHCSARSLLQVVTETTYQGRKNHLTEKTFKPIVMKQPFVLVANKNSLEYLRKYGFETFSSVWNESYDNENDEDRIKSVAWLLEELEHSNCQKWLAEQCAPIVEHNYNHFYSGAFERILWEELTKMVESW